MTKANRISAELICTANISAALDLAALCFPKKSDQDLLGLDFHAFARGKRRQFDSVLRRASTVHGYYCFYENRAMVGIAGAYSYDDDPTAMWMCWIGVHPDARLRGIGREIIDYLIELARDKNCLSFCCVTSDAPSNANVRAFYEAQGFVNEGVLTFRDETLRQYRKLLQ